MPVNVTCEQCGETKSVVPARATTFKFCSTRCKGDWQSIHRARENHPRWQDISRQKECQHCGAVFHKKDNYGIEYWQRAKFCSKACADIGGLRYSGPDNWRWNGNPRRSHVGGHAAWAQAVISRDKATCQHCGANGVELHAHHIKPYQTHPELREDVSNGLTLCHTCHWAVHSGPSANGVNSGEAASGHAGGNPEPSFDGNVVEGVTTRGRAYRRWEGSCENCGTFISKRLSNVKGKSHHYCSKSCAWSDYWRRWRMAQSPTAVMPPRAPRRKRMI